MATGDESVLRLGGSVLGEYRPDNLYKLLGHRLIQFNDLAWLGLQFSVV